MTMKLTAHPGSFWQVPGGAPGFRGSVNEITKLFSGAGWAALLRGTWRGSPISHQTKEQC